MSRRWVVGGEGKEGEGGGEWGERRGGRGGRIKGPDEDRGMFERKGERETKILCM